MTQLLVLGSAILSVGPFDQAGTTVKSADAIFPKHIIGGHQIVDVTLPPGFTIAGYEWIGGALSEKALVSAGGIEA